MEGNWMLMFLYGNSVVLIISTSKWIVEDIVEIHFDRYSHSLFTKQHLYQHTAIRNRVELYASVQTCTAKTNC